MPEIIDAVEFSTAILDGLASRKKLVRIPSLRSTFKGRILESAVLLLSDIHAGQVNKSLKPGNTKSTITYNSDIMVKEFNRLLDGIFTINQLLSSSYRIDKLYIFGLGDYIENDVIFKGQRFFIDKPTGEQLGLLTGVMTDFLSELLKEFKEIEFICITGNHGRFQMSREAAPACNSFDYFLGKNLEMIFRNEPRIKIVIPDNWYYFVDIYKWRYFLHHGDTVYSWMSIPYYGLKRQGTARRVEEHFDLECIGHFHQVMTVPIGGESKTIVNGSWINDSDWGWRKFGQKSKAEQYYFGVSPKRARTWRWTIDLSHSLNEKRYLLTEK